MLDVLWIQKGKAREIILVKIHHKHLVSGGQVNCLAGKLAVKVGDIFSMALLKRGTLIMV
jgi:hypothetical protein